MSFVSYFKGLLLKAEIHVSKAVGCEIIDPILLMLRPKQTQIALQRVGPINDGGYLVPTDSFSVDAVFSPGVDFSADFELEFAEQGIPCFLIDGSVVKSPVDHRNIHFESLWLSQISVMDESINLDDWIRNKKLTHSRNLLLQMDIEGAEYRTLLNTEKETLSKFRILVLELHDIQSITSRSGSTLISNLLIKLAETHILVHTHVNNCTEPLLYKGRKIPDVLELTFVRADSNIQISGFATIPHSQDAPNTLNKDWQLDWHWNADG